MAELQNFGYTPTGSVSVTVPNWDITAVVSDGGAQIADYTGENTLHFPALLNGLSGEQQSALLGLIAQQIVMLKAGLA